MSVKANLQSEYVPMADGTRLAVSSWLTAGDVNTHNPCPAVLVTTRYWRAMALSPDNLEEQAYTGWANRLIDNGYRLVVADARGTGASFGTRHAEVDRNEVSDIGEIIEWVASQSWCDGRVATHGTSYSGITTLYSLATTKKSLKVGICRAPDFDMYRHLIAPGGIVNRWFVEGWGAHTAAQDNNDIDAMFSAGYLPVPEQGFDNILGVRPVDSDDGLLASAISEHKSNFNLAQSIDELDFIENFLKEHNPPVYHPCYHKHINNCEIPLVIRCGWHDAATALGALSLYATFEHLPVQVILGPFNHEGTYRVDPFSREEPESTPLDEGRAWRIDSLNTIFKPEGNQAGGFVRGIHYYTLGENRWKTTSQWPLQNTTMQRFYFNDNHRLNNRQPRCESGEDNYKVDPTSTTGRFNRWHAQSADQPVYFEDRRQEDKKLLVYDSEPLQVDTEITGHPVVCLYIRSSESDCDFFVYLEVVDIDGRIKLLTEGQLRGIHRKVSNEKPPYTMFGPYHSLEERDSEPLGNEKINHLVFDLLPISVVLKKHQRIRITIAGADCETFASNMGGKASSFSVERNSRYSSCIDLPIQRGL